MVLTSSTFITMHRLKNIGYADIEYVECIYHVIAVGLVYFKAFLNSCCELLQSSKDSAMAWFLRFLHAIPRQDYMLLL